MRRAWSTWTDGHMLEHGVLEYMGDSRGSWQGQTLVVETTNFKEGGGVNRAFSRHARMTERFTRIDERTLRYEVTVDDPKRGRNHGRSRSRSNRIRATTSSSLRATKATTGACDRCSEGRGSKTSKVTTHLKG